VIEGNLEVRVPLSGKVEGVVFTDFGQVWDATQAASLADVEVSPGFGLRYMSPIGPLRLDLAYRFRSGEELAVVTEQIRPYQPGVDEPGDRLVWNGARQPWVTSGALAVLRPRVLYGESKALSWSRLQLHLSIGQAF
jgi:hypothetical protein